MSPCGNKAAYEIIETTINYCTPFAIMAYSIWSLWKDSHVDTFANNEVGEQLKDRFKAFANKVNIMALVLGTLFTTAKLFVNNQIKTITECETKESNAKIESILDKAESVRKNLSLSLTMSKDIGANQVVAISKTDAVNQNLIVTSSKLSGQIDIFQKENLRQHELRHSESQKIEKKVDSSKSKQRAMLGNMPQRMGIKLSISKDTFIYKINMYNSGEIAAEDVRGQIKILLRIDSNYIVPSKPIPFYIKNIAAFNPYEITVTNTYESNVESINGLGAIFYFIIKGEYQDGISHKPLDIIYYYELDTKETGDYVEINNLEEVYDAKVQ